MANLGQAFNARTVDPSKPLDVVPPGKYMVWITKSTIKQTKDQGGTYLELEFDILEGEFKGRKLWDRLNMWNNNAQTVEIAQKAFSAICHATGVLDVTDTEVLHNKPMIATVKVDQERVVNGKKYEASNVIKGYEALPKTGTGAPPPPPQQQNMQMDQPQQNAAPPVTGGAQQQSAPVTGRAATGAKTPPWRRAAG